MNQKLKNAQSHYLEGIRDGNVREAVTQYTGDRYTQHSTGVNDGIESFVEFFSPLSKKIQSVIFVFYSVLLTEIMYFFMSIRTSMKGLLSG